MTDTEFEIIDECYFVISFKDLSDKINLPEGALITELRKLYEKRWMRCFRDVSEEVFLEDIVSDKDLTNYYYLASKEGLKAHNTL